MGTGNQHINDQLIQIWNEHYLYNASDASLIAKDEHQKIDELKKPIKNKQIIEIEPVIIKQPEIPKIVHSETVKADFKRVTVSKSDNQSIWKFIWNSPFLHIHKIQIKNKNINLLLHPIYDININIDYEQKAQNISDKGLKSPMRSNEIIFEPQKQQKQRKNDLEGCKFRSSDNKNIENK